MISAVACSALLAYALPAPATGDRLSEKPTQWHTLAIGHSDTGYASRDQRVGGQPATSHSQTSVEAGIRSEHTGAVFQRRVQRCRRTQAALPV